MAVIDIFADIIYTATAKPPILARPFKKPAIKPTNTSQTRDWVPLNCQSRHKAKQAIKTPPPAKPRTISGCQYCKANTPKGVPIITPINSMVTHIQGMLRHTFGNRCKLANISNTNIRGTIVCALNTGAKAKKHKAEKPKPAKPLTTPASKTMPKTYASSK